jgi:hypothetical protein
MTQRMENQTSYVPGSRGLLLPEMASVELARASARGAAIMARPEHAAMALTSVTPSGVSAAG